MSPEQFQKLMGTFQDALTLEGEERRRFLDERCQGDADLRRELDALLGQPLNTSAAVATGGGLAAFYDHGKSGGILGATPRPGTDKPGPPSRLRPPGDSTPSADGTRPGDGSSCSIAVLSGAYRLLRVVGEGGMGIVYEAEQAFPRRTVAIKALRPALATRGMLRRFLNEAHTLGRLQHPGIAQIYEAGAADAARPDEAFFVMEYVDGPPLTTYARERKLSTRAKLELFIKVCEAVQHAHQRGVIHRDLKPANILVAQADGQPQPKVLDFGVARAVRVDEQLTHVNTAVGQLVGTLAYMSPEQVSGDPQGVDTRSDVYALGVILHEMLAGRPPYDVAGKPLPEVARVIRDQEPARLGLIDRSLRGDVETIVRKALDKDRARRYQSALELGEDLRRHLRGEPIAARRDSALYVLRKQVRRHRAAAALAAVIFLGAIAFGVVAGVQASRNRELAAGLARELAVANVQRAHLQIAAGTPSLGERTIWSEWMQRPDLPEAYWGLVGFYARQPIARSGGGSGFQPGEMAVAPDRSVIVATGRDAEAEAWSGDLTRLLWRRRVAPQGTPAVEFLRDGSAVLTGGSDGYLNLFEPSTGRLLAHIPTSLQPISELAISPDGTSLFVGSGAGQAELWSIAPPPPGKVTPTLSRRLALRPRTDGLRDAAFDPSGQYVATLGRTGGVNLYQLADARQLTRTNTPGGIAGRLAYSPDGRLLFVLMTGGALQIIDTSDMRIRRALNLQDREANTFAFLGDRPTFVSAGEHGIRLWDLAAEKCLRVLPGHEHKLESLAESVLPGFAVANGMGTTLRLLDLREGVFPEPLPGTGSAWPHGSEPSPDARYLISADAAGAVRVWDLPGRRLLWTIAGPGPRSRSVAWRPGAHQFAVGFSEGRVGLFDAERGSTVAVWEAAETDISAVAFSPDGKLLGVGQLSGPVRVISADDGSLVREMEPGQEWVTGLSFGPDARLIAAAGKRVGVGVYDVATGKRTAAIADVYQNWRVIYNPDGSELIACRARPEIELLDAATLTPLRTFRGHADAVLHADVDWPARRLLTGGVDGTVRLWDLDTGRELLQLKDNDEQVSWAAFVPGARAFATCHERGRVLLWDLARFDAMIAGNMSYMYARHLAAHGPPVDRARLEAWARTITADPTFTLADPRGSVPLLPLPKDELESASTSAANPGPR